MTRYKVEKWDYKKHETVDYGYYSNIEDVKAIVKGYTKDEEFKKICGFDVYSRKNSTKYFAVMTID